MIVNDDGDGGDDDDDEEDDKTTYQGTPQFTQPTLFKMDTFGTSSKCPSQRDVHFIESHIKGAKKDRDQIQVSIL